MQVFYEGWRLVQSLCASDFTMPKEVAIPSPIDREVARMYVERRDYPVEEVLDATGRFAQPHLLETTTENVQSTAFQANVAPGTGTIVSPSAIPADQR